VKSYLKYRLIRRALGLFGLADSDPHRNPPSIEDAESQRDIARESRKKREELQKKMEERLNQFNLSQRPKRKRRRLRTLSVLFLLATAYRIVSGIKDK
jgi:hypothetical protein